MAGWAGGITTFALALAYGYDLSRESVFGSRLSEFALRPSIPPVLALDRLEGQGCAGSQTRREAGGLVVATAGLAAAAFMNAGTFVVMAAILIGSRPRSSAPPKPPPAGGNGGRSLVGRLQHAPRPADPGRRHAG